MPFDPEVLNLFAVLEAANLPRVSQLAPAEARVMYRMGTERNGGTPADMTAVRDLAAEGPA